MNRSGKRPKQSREGRRPRRQDYQPLLLYDDLQSGIDEESGHETNDNSLQLLSKEPEKFVEKAVEPGDTLLSISLQFNCPVAELKRVNHIIRDNEIFARRTIKVPIKPGSVVTEKLARVHSNGGLNKCDESDLHPGFLDKERATTSNDCPKDSPKSIPYFGTLNLKPIDILKSEGPLLFTERLVDIDDDSTDIVSRPLLEEGTKEVVSNKDEVFMCNGADWGISWLQLVLFALLLGCTGPILYIVLIAEKNDSSTAAHTTTTTPTTVTTAISTEIVKFNNEHTL